MEQTLAQLSDQVVARQRKWEEAKNPKQPTSVFVCNRRIQKLNEALELISQMEAIADYTKRS